MNYTFISFQEELNLIYHQTFTNDNKYNDNFRGIITVLNSIYNKKEPINQDDNFLVTEEFLKSSNKCISKLIGNIETYSGEYMNDFLKDKVNKRTLELIKEYCFTCSDKFHGLDYFQTFQLLFSIIIKSNDNRHYNFLEEEIYKSIHEDNITRISRLIKIMMQ